MKKTSIVLLVILLLAVLLTLTACGNKKENSIHIQDAIQKFKDAGYEVKLEDKPYYSMIGAEDGEMFYLDGAVVKLYEFKDENAYKKGTETFSQLKDFPKKGLVVLDTNSDKAKEIFNSL